MWHTVKENPAEKVAQEEQDLDGKTRGEEWRGTKDLWRFDILGENSGGLLDWGADDIWMTLWEMEEYSTWQKSKDWILKTFFPINALSITSLHNALQHQCTINCTKVWRVAFWSNRHLGLILKTIVQSPQGRVEHRVPERRYPHVRRWRPMATIPSAAGPPAA